MSLIQVAERDGCVLHHAEDMPGVNDVSATRTSVQSRAPVSRRWCMYGLGVLACMAVVSMGVYGVLARGSGCTDWDAGDPVDGNLRSRRLSKKCGKFKGSPLNIPGDECNTHAPISEHAGTCAFHDIFSERGGLEGIIKGLQVTIKGHKVTLKQIDDSGYAFVLSGDCSCSSAKLNKVAKFPVNSIMPVEVPVEVADGCTQQKCMLEDIQSVSNDLLAKYGESAVKITRDDGRAVKMFVFCTCAVSA